MDLLVFNCGSSSQGFTLFRTNGSETPEIPAHGKARNVATLTKADSVLEWTAGADSGTITADLSSHRAAAELILSVLEGHGLHPDAVGHRFVNGGTFFSRTARLDAEGLEKLKACLPLAPIHNPNSFSVIEVCRRRLPGIPQYAVFDTAFHSSMPEENRVYAIPQSTAAAGGFRKIGFHGLSYQYISGRAAVLLGKPFRELKLVMCHLGTGGSSVCACRDGHSVDSSMGYSPLSGLIMSTRCGDLDPEIVLDLIRSGMTPDQVSGMLNKKSGLQGLSGYSSNLGEIIAAAKDGNKDCALAFNAYVSRLRKYIGAFLYELNGADALIFTDDAGIRYPELREAVCADAGSFGLELDPDENRAYDRKSEKRLSTAGSRIQIWAIPTDEERTIYNEILDYEKQNA